MVDYAWLCYVTLCYVMLLSPHGRQVPTTASTQLVDCKFFNAISSVTFDDVKPYIAIVLALTA
jgi:hypothetical protein